MKRLNFAGSRGGFTLIEVMIVVIILVALASMVVPYLMDVPDRMKAKIVVADMQRLDTALKLYRLDTGAYPATLAALTKPAGIPGKTTPYLEKEPEDPWKELYKYKAPGTHGTLGYDLWSSGPNKRDDGGENDDIPNWERKQ